MSELDRGRKHNRFRKFPLFLSLLHYIIILHVRMSLSFEKRQGYKKSEKYVGPVVITRSNTMHGFTQSVDFRLSR